MSTVYMSNSSRRALAAVEAPRTGVIKVWASGGDAAEHFRSAGGTSILGVRPNAHWRGEIAVVEQS
jgi:hypothetical protein